MIFKKRILFILILFLGSRIIAQEMPPVQFPDILGYKTLQCDFHLHTVFSDGQVWPTVRVDEAWRDGLDAISVTDHIEYRPNLNLLAEGKKFQVDLNQSWQVASEKAARFGILVIKGAEITRSMPPGHFNAFFLSDINPLDTPWKDDGSSRQGWKGSGLLIDNWKDAFYEAKKQGALIFWNHPGWKTQQPDTTLWWPEHTWLLENHLMDGIEVVNGNSYSPEAHQWAIDKDLAIISGSDSHGPAGGKNRPVTLIFAGSQEPEPIKEALINHRSAVFFDNKLIGNEKFLNAIFKASIVLESVLKSVDGLIIVIHNKINLPFELSKIEGNIPGMKFPDSFTIQPGRRSIIPVIFEKLPGIEELDLKITIKNLLTAPGQGLTTIIPVNNED